MIVFRVKGEPMPKGSKTPRIVNGRVVGSYESANMKRKKRKGGALTRWMDATGWAAKAAMRQPLLEGPVAVTMTFYLARPATIRRDLPHVKPDADKLARAVLDALTGIVWKDDGQVTSMRVLKRYVDVDPGVGVSVYTDCLLREEMA